MRGLPILFLLTLALLVVAPGCPNSIPPAPPPNVQLDDSEPLRDLVAKTLGVNRQNRYLTVDEHGAWQVLHGVLAYGDQFEIRTGNGNEPAVDYLLSGRPLKGFELQPGDSFQGRTGIRLGLDPTNKIGQGHRDQWLAILLQSGMKSDTAFQVGDQTLTLRDWIHQAQYDTPLNLEYEFSWTLIALTTLDPTSTTWQARDGQTYNIESLLQSELSQSIPDSVCGGTHRMIGIATALNRRKQETQTLDGAWADANELVEAAIQSAKENQNPDGSFSLHYFQRPGWASDLGDAIGTTGHMVEFLSVASPTETLREPWVEKSVRRLCEMLKQCEKIDLECGVLYHALHGLFLYQNRVFGPDQTVNADQI